MWIILRLLLNLLQYFFCLMFWFFGCKACEILGFPGGSDGKESACNTGDVGSISRSGRSPGEGNGNPLQYPCLGNPMKRGAWWVTVRGVTKELDMAERLSTHATGTEPTGRLVLLHPFHRRPLQGFCICSFFDQECSSLHIHKTPFLPQCLHVSA